MTQTVATETINVLHVDDDPEFGDLAKVYIEKLDDRCSVHTEHNPYDGLDRIENELIDCVVSDYQMPEMDGLEFLNAIRDHYPNLPFILFTGKGSEEIATEAINAGATSYLQKGGPEVFELLQLRIDTIVSRRRSERRAQIARDRLFQMYERTDGFYAVNKDWEVTYWNRLMEERTGITAEEITGQNLWEIFPEATDTEFYERYTYSMENDKPLEFDAYYDVKDLWLSVKTQPDSEGLFIISRDVTDERKRQREIQYRNELLESFASTVSHDLRNPLSVAEGNLRLAKETGDFEHLEQVARAHNRMRDLIDELLDFARGEELELSALSLRDVAESAWEVVTSPKAELVVDEDMVLHAYEAHFRRLLENMFWNSLDHGNASAVRVGTIENGFFVEDDGTGIPKSHRERIFNSGFSTKEESPGYGLSIVKGIVETHNWEISVVSGSDSGARFDITGVAIGDK